MDRILDEANIGLYIFSRPVEIDHNLPKWQHMAEKKKQDHESAKSADGISSGDRNTYITSILPSQIGDTSSNITFRSTPLWRNDFSRLDRDQFNTYLGKTITNFGRNVSGGWYSTPDISFEDGDKPKTVFGRIKAYFKKAGARPKFDIISFFEQVKLTSDSNKEAYAERVTQYLQMIEDARIAGQEALIDTIGQQMVVCKYESLLYAEGMCKRITEEQVVQFVKQAEKGIRICYVKNFIRPIPKDVIEKKKAADDLEIFDNYCVMFYDKGIPAHKMTERERKEEINRKKDPILFGMIHGSHNLYYIADWTDKYCDLTLDEFIRVTQVQEEEITISKDFEPKLD